MKTLYNCLPWDKINRKRETGKRDHISLSFEMTLTLEDAILPGENRNKNKRKRWNHIPRSIKPLK